MTQPVDIDLNLSGDYTDQVGAATQATQGLQTALDGVQAPARGVQRALDLATPSRAHLAAWGGFTAAAAYWQGQTSGIRATAAAAGQSIRVLDGDVNRLARTFPVGTAGAVAMVQAVQSLGAQEKQIGPLANVMERLSGATGFGPQLAIDFGQLNREMASLDPARVQRFGDVLTTVSAKSGASAAGIVNFAQAIAPVAQQAGIGESAVLGISSAFVKLGEDGGAAATAVNKILGDLNRSVREGSNDMTAYAQITGMTVNQFRAMYQANPAQTLAAVTTAIGKAGPQGQMALESLGLEGVRTQRALLQLSQSGGLQQAVSQATGAYGNNSTELAARQAFGGLNDSLTELRSTAGQTADALGGPFLHVLTRITDIAKVGLQPVNALLGSGPGQRSIQTLGGLVVAGMVARRVVRPLGALALGQQAATSGPVRSLFGGYALHRAGGDADMALLSRAGQFGRDPLIDSTYGVPYGRQFMRPVNAAFLRAGGILGDARVAAFGAPEAPGFTGGPGLGGLLRAGARTGITASTMAYDAWAKSFADPFKQSMTPAGQRVSLLTPAQGGLFNRANEVRQQAGVRVALGMLQREGGTTAANLGRLSAATIGATKAVSIFAGGTIRAGGTAAGGVLRSAGSGLLGLAGGPLGLALMGGLGAYGIYQHEQAQQRAMTEHMQNIDIYGVLNSYRDSMGQAGQASMSMAEVMKSAVDTIQASINNIPSAKTVTPADILAAGPVTPASAQAARDKSAISYHGTTAQVRAEVQATNLSGLGPQDLQAAKQDLLKQGFEPQHVEQILAGVNAAGTGGRLTGRTLRGLVGGAVGTGGRGYSTKVTDELVAAIGQQQYALQQRFGQNYARQRTGRTLQSVSALISQYAGGATDKYTVAERLAAAFGGEYGTPSMQRLANAPTLPAHLQPSILEAPLRGAGANALLPFFAAATAPPQFRAGQRAAQYVASGHEADISAQTTAVNKMVDAATGAGASLIELALQATKASSSTADWQQQMMEAIAAEAQFEQQVRLQGASRGVQLSAAVTSDLRYIAAGPGTDPNGFQAKQYAQAKSDLASQRQSLISFYQQRVMTQYQFQIQSERSQQDYQRQVSRSEKDFQRSRFRALRDFNIQMTRETQDAAKTLYDPYTRIAVQPVWDAFNLSGNSQEQIQAMRQQIANVNKLRDLGLDEATIRMLGLYAPDKAQQAQELVMDLQGHSGEVRTLNQQTATRTRLAGQLMSQDPQYQRQRQDFNRNLRDQQRDFNIARSRMETDFAISQQRMAQDLATQDLQITNNMTKLTRDMADIIHGRFVDLHRQVVDSLTNTQSAVNRIWPSINNTLLHPGSAHGGSGATTSGGVSAAGGRAGGGYGNAAVGGGRGPATTTEHGMGSGGAVVAPDRYVKPGTGELYHGQLRSTGRGSSDYRPADGFIQAHPADPNFNRSIAKRMRPDWAKRYWGDWDALWSGESGWNQYADNPNSDAYGIPQSLPATKMAGAGGDWRTNPATQIRWGIDYIAGRYGNPTKAMAHENRYGWYGAGGVFTGPTVAGMGERGPEAAIPLNEHGMKFMLSALRQYIGAADAKLISSGGLLHATQVHISSDTYTYDSGQHIHGPITVKANSPRELADAMEAKQRMDNLTGTRGVSWRQN